MKSISHGHLKDSFFKHKMLISLLVRQANYTLCFLLTLLTDVLHVWLEVWWATGLHPQTFILLYSHTCNCFDSLFLSLFSLKYQQHWCIIVLLHPVVMWHSDLKVVIAPSVPMEWSAVACGMGSDTRSDKRWNRCVITFAKLHYFRLNQ